MTRFRCATFVWSLLILPAISAASRAADAPADDHLAPLARFVGEWEVEGKWSDGSPLHARATYEWGLNKKILVAKTFVKDPGKSEYQRYEGILAWNPRKKSLYEVSFAHNGEMTEVLIDPVNKDTLHIGYQPFHEGEPQNVRQILHFAGDDAFVWTVSLKMGNDWTRLIEATWKRKGK
jgi:hypothetical protein